MAKEKIHTTIGLYASSYYKINGVLESDLEFHIQYNKVFRPGRALFVDGKCVYKGYLSDEKVKEFEKKIETENIKVKKCTAPYH